MKISGTESTLFLPWKSDDREAADADRATRVEGISHLHLAGIERHCRGEGLEGRAHLIGARRHPVEPVLFKRLDRIVRIVVGQRRHGEHFAGVNIEHHASRRDCLVAVDCRGQFIAQHMLNPQIQRQPHRLEILVKRHANGRKVTEPLPVDIFLHAGDALVVDVDVTDDMRRGGTAGIEPAGLGPEADTGNAKCQDLALLLWRKLTPQPLEAGVGGEFAMDPAQIEIGQHGGEQFDGLVRHRQSCWVRQTATLCGCRWREPRHCDPEDQDAKPSTGSNG
jgi:hypothetical protein